MSEKTHRTDYEQYIKDLAEFMDSNGCSLRPFPKIHLSNRKQNGFFIRTAFYDPETKEVTVYINNRAPKDCMRSLAHEFVHHHQNLEGRLVGYSGDTLGQDGKLDDLEAEAYQTGNILFRKWTETKTKSETPKKTFTKHMKKKISLNESRINEIIDKIMEDFVDGIHPNGQLDMFMDQLDVNDFHDFANFTTYHDFFYAVKNCGWEIADEQDVKGGKICTVAPASKKACSASEVQTNIINKVPNSKYLKFGERTFPQRPGIKKFIVFIPNHETIDF
jgi:hypothetical protein